MIEPQWYDSVLNVCRKLQKNNNNNNNNSTAKTNKKKKRNNDNNDNNNNNNNNNSKSTKEIDVDYESIAARAKERMVEFEELATFKRNLEASAKRDRRFGAEPKKMEGSRLISQEDENLLLSRYLEL